ncbi:MAG TPA: dual specificity protein phosphatase [Anaerolineae bacterium]|nr:dual specificity protein phosphatase [Anaerolineae bacterium]
MDFSAITDSLYVGTAPRSKDYDTLRELGIELVLNVRIDRWPYRDLHNPALRSLWLPTFDSAFIPIPLAVLRRGVVAALEVLEAGGKVYIHCTKGIHRSVAMAAAVLIAQGYSVDEATQLLKSRRAVADPDIWYIRRQIRRFARYWEKRTGLGTIQSLSDS